LIGKLQGSQPSFYHVDGLGSTRVLTNGLGAVTDSYFYDAFGNSIVSTGGSGNAYLFAGEQRDGETGLDYLRARYYDPLVGRFVSADAYEGTLNDPMSLHDYQYAHANPVVNTDPSGYFSIGELLGTMAGYSVLAGLSYTTGSAVAELAGGGSIYDAVAKYDQFFAGLTDALTFGISSEARRLAYGETATANHKGLFFNLGRLGGAIASMWIGANGATFAEFSSASWVPRAALGYDLFGAGLGMAQSTINVAKGQATWWDILPFLPALTWFNIKYKVNVKGLGSNFGNLEITRRLSAEVQDLRTRSGVIRYVDRNGDVQGGTVGIALTDIPGLETRVFGGASPQAHINLGEVTRGDIKSPAKISKGRNHAEEELGNTIAKAIDSSNLTNNDLVGKTIYMHIETMPCSTCKSGLASDKAAGVLKQLSERYPQLRIIVTAENSSQSIIIQGGTRIE